MARHQLHPKKGERFGGRKVGTPNKISVEARVLAGQLVNDVQYQARLRADFRKRRVHPTIESLLWQYHLGRPLQSVALSGGLDIEVSGRLDDERAAFAALDLEDLEMLAAESQRLVNRAFQLAGITLQEPETPQHIVVQSPNTEEPSELLAKDPGSNNESSVNYEDHEPETP